MRYILILLSFLVSNISSAQSGWGYVNYTSYKTHNGNGSTNQYGAFPNTKLEFDNMLNTANSNTTITHTGETQIVKLYNGSLQVPRWANDYFAYKFDFWFVPQQTGLYYFGINSDDASDLLVNDNVLVSFYGGHGASGFQVVGMNMVAGQRYKMVFRGQEYGGGEAFYFKWYRPVGGWGYWENEVTNQQTTSVDFTFDFGQNIDKTKFKSKIITSSDDITYNTSNPLIALSNLGRVDLTDQIDTIEINGNGYKALTTGGNVEWCVIYDYDNINKRYRVGVDAREFTGTGVTPSTVSKLKLFDLWDGDVTYNSYDPNGWAEYWIYTNTQFNFSGSSFASKIRQGNGFHGVSAEFSFIQNTMFKYHKISMDIQQSDLLTLLGSAVTVGDVYLAFKEFADKGILGDESKYFTSGIQFHNADVNDDGVFDERDCYALLTHLQGTTSLWSNPPALGDIMKIVNSSAYDNITKQNWNTYTGITRYRYPFTFTNGILNAYNLDITWKGDVNLSHSSQPVGFVTSANSISGVSQIKSMSVSANSIGDVEADIMMERVGDSVVATIMVNPNGNQIGATQFDVYFDNSVLSFSSTQFTTSGGANFSRNNGSFISLGSLNTSGGSISNIGYKVVFKPKSTITNLLGLISVKSTETLNTSLNKINVKVL